mmetsp:Transcript_117558/g.377387  ORF Transcript_117558/g.377387 Transcript_117558/m.377387 type:complete len:211 (+) Transcript_117558:590-1222(+)
MPVHSARRLHEGCDVPVHHRSVGLKEADAFVHVELRQSGLDQDAVAGPCPKHVHATTTARETDCIPQKIKVRGGHENQITDVEDVEDQRAKDEHDGLSHRDDLHPVDRMKCQEARHFVHRPQLFQVHIRIDNDHLVGLRQKGPQLQNGRTLCTVVHLTDASLVQEHEWAIEAKDSGKISGEKQKEEEDWHKEQPYEEATSSVDAGINKGK